MFNPGKSIVLYNNQNSNNHLVADALAECFKCNSVAAESSPTLAAFDTVIIVVPNVGDEELPKAMEDYLCNLTDRNKQYVVCELGNYFGFEYQGCKQLVCRLLDQLGWEKIDDVSFDSYPQIDWDAINEWLNKELFRRI